MFDRAPEHHSVTSAGVKKGSGGVLGVECRDEIEIEIDRSLYKSISQVFTSIHPVAIGTSSARRPVFDQGFGAPSCLTSHRSCLLVTIPGLDIAIYSLLAYSNSL